MFKKLKSLFVIEEGEPAEIKESPSGPEIKRETFTTAGSGVVKMGDPATGHVQNKFLEVLFGALEASNQEGFDYLEFKDFLRSLSNVPMEDSIRYKSAFATAQTMGATKENLLASARTYMDLLTREEIKFQEALHGQREKNLTVKHQEIKKLEKTIQDKQGEIDKLKNDIEQHRKEIGSLETEINTASEKLAQTANDFAATYQALLGQIQTDVKNIESHI